LVPLTTRESHNTTIGIIYAALYVMFGVIVGFSAYLVLNKYNLSETTAKTEASNVEELYWLAEQLPQQERDEVQELTASYARVVVDEEWPLMKNGQESPRADALVNDLRRSIEGFEPARTPSRQSILRSWSESTIWTRPERFVCSTFAKAYPSFCGSLW
jgi:hypothetical protein